MPYAFNPFTGTLDYYAAAAVSTSPPAVPLVVAAGATYTVAANSQVIYGVEITNNGTIVNNGQLIKVRSA